MNPIHTENIGGNDVRFYPDRGGRVRYIFAGGEAFGFATLDDAIADAEKLADQIETSVAAATLGRLGSGKPKSFSAAERKRRAERLAVARAKRWTKK